MRIHLIAVGTRMPGWVREGYEDYVRRLPPSCMLQLVEIPLSHRRRSTDTQRLKGEEGRRLLAATPDGSRVIALDVTGTSWTTEQLAARLDHWMGSARDVAMLVGGPDGLSADCLQRADTRWSLSALTLPHQLVRILIAEQVYRAWSILARHPYHRA
jgi:23S rRNA (pseudouridine1915-N3)-methyltransferase